MKSEKQKISKALTASGITLIALTITIIVLVILAGISLKIGNSIIIDKAVETSNITNQASAKEQVEFAWANAESTYWEEKDNISISKEEYYNTKIEEFLDDSAHFQNVSAIFENNNRIIQFSDENQNYEFAISSSGEVSERKLLKGNVKIGDYIQYDVGYTDVYLGTTYNSTNGWRVIDDGTMDEDSPCVKIISTGIPAKWNYRAKQDYGIENAINDLKNNFENLDLFITTKQKWEKDAFKIDDKATYLTTLTLEQINSIGINSDLFQYDTDKLYGYWIANMTDERDAFYYLSDEGLQTYNENYRTGVRPIIYLNTELKGERADNNLWKNVN